MQRSHRALSCMTYIQRRGRRQGVGIHGDEGIVIALEGLDSVEERLSKFHSGEQTLSVRHLDIRHRHLDDIDLLAMYRTPRMERRGESRDGNQPCRRDPPTHVSDHPNRWDGGPHLRPNPNHRRHRLPPIPDGFGSSGTRCRVARGTCRTAMHRSRRDASAHATQP